MISRACISKFFAVFPVRLLTALLLSTSFMIAIGHYFDQCTNHNQQCFQKEWINNFCFEKIKPLMGYILIEKLQEYSIVYGVFFYIIGVPNQALKERERSCREAWIVVNSALEQSGSGGRIKALETLNSAKENLSELTARQANLENVKLTKANLKLADLSKATLTGANLAEADLTGVILTGANLVKANLTQARLWSAHLELDGDSKETQLREVILKEADLYRAKCHKTNFTSANLREAKLIEADLREAKLIKADLSNANLSEADLEAANLEGATGLTLSQLKKAKNWKLAKFVKLQKFTEQEKQEILTNKLLRDELVEWFKLEQLDRYWGDENSQFVKNLIQSTTT